MNTIYIWIALVVVLLPVAYWLAYRVIRAAVCRGVRSAGLVGPSSMLHLRKTQDMMHDFVYSKPHY